MEAISNGFNLSTVTNPFFILTRLLVWSHAYGNHSSRSRLRSALLPSSPAYRAGARRQDFACAGRDRPVLTACAARAVYRSLERESLTALARKEIRYVTIRFGRIG